MIIADIAKLMGHLLVKWCVRGQSGTYLGKVANGQSSKWVKWQVGKVVNGQSDCGRTCCGPTGKWADCKLHGMNHDVELNVRRTSFEFCARDSKRSWFTHHANHCKWLQFEIGKSASPMYMSVLRPNYSIGPNYSWDGPNYSTVVGAAQL